MNGVWAFLTNGTNIYTSANDTEVQFDSGKRNYTFNATGYNQLWLHVTADPSYQGQPNFLAEIGLRELKKGDEEEEEVEEDDDDDDDTQFEAIVIPTYKSITLNEEIIIYSVMGGLILYCCKCFFCAGAWAPPKKSIETLVKEKIEMKKMEKMENENVSDNDDDDGDDDETTQDEE